MTNEIVTTVHLVGCGCELCVVRAEISEMRKALNEEKNMANQLEMCLVESTCEIKRLQDDLRQCQADRDLYKKWMNNYKLAVEKVAKKWSKR